MHKVLIKTKIAKQMLLLIAVFLVLSFVYVCGSRQLLAFQPAPKSAWLNLFCNERQKSDAEKLTDNTMSVSNTDTRPDSDNEVQLNAQKEAAAGIKTSVISRQALKKRLEFCSTVEAPGDTSGAVYSLFNGVITRVLINVGDHVKAGQVVAYVNSPDIADGQSAYLHALAKVKECTAELKLAETRAAISATQETRLAGLVQEGIAAQREVEVAKSQMAGVQAELAAADSAKQAATAQLRSTQVRLSSMGLKTPSQDLNNVTCELPIKSPIRGIITQRLLNPGQTVGPAALTVGNKSGELATVADLSKVWVMLEVPQAQVADLKLGENVHFRSEVAPNEDFLGRVTKLGENFDPLSHIVLVRTEIENHGGILKPGMLIIASLGDDGGGSKSLIIPLSAVQNIEGKDFVFIATGNHRFCKQEVHCGERTAEQVVIKSGVNAGQPIVTSGTFFLKTEFVRSSLGGGAE